MVSSLNGLGFKASGFQIRAWRGLKPRALTQLWRKVLEYDRPLSNKLHPGSRDPIRDPSGGSVISSTLKEAPRL